MKKIAALLLVCLAVPAAGANDTDILELNPKQEVLPLLLNARKPARTWNHPDAPESLTLLQCSDLHGYLPNLERIIEFKNEYSEYIQDAIHLGDAVIGYYDNPNPWDQVKGAEGVLNIIGNHDCWKGHLVWAQTDHPYDATQEEAYDKMFVGADPKNPLISHWGVTQPEGVNKRKSADWKAGYYYKDYPESGVRLIVLDCVHYFERQNEWFAQTLEDARTKDLLVVAATHYPAQSGVDKIECGFSPLRIEIRPVGDPGESQMERMPDSAYSAVDKFIEDGGTFVCWLSGHEHFDYVGTVTGHKSQLEVIVDKCGEGDGYMIEDRTLGTRNQDSFNLVTVNPSKGLVIVQRIGCNRNADMRSKNIFCYDFRHNKLIVSD